MVGQGALIKSMRQLITSNRLPHFIILVGQVGSGRKTLIGEVFKQTDYTTIPVSKEVAQVREMIDSSRFVSTPTLYTLFDADNMSLSAKNSLLKIAEEPPQNVYIVMTIQSKSSMPDTILSRAYVISMQPYTYGELKKCVGADENFDLYKNIAETPFDIIALRACNIDKFNEYVNLTLNNIHRVSGSNSFKIGNRLNLNGSGEFDLVLFWRAFRNECLKAFMTTHETYYSTWIQITSRYLTDITKYASINKSSTFDLWVLDIRKAWNNANSQT